MKYSILDFQKEFPNDDTCLEYIFKKKYPDSKGWYRVSGRKAYANAEGKQIYPLSKTIFEKSDTSLVKWFYAIFLFSQSKNGVSAKELQRQLSVTYKTAWRIGKQIRQLMTQDDTKLGGTIEADETYIGGTRRMKVKMENKTPVIGAVRRGGKIKAQALKNREEYSVIPFLMKNVKKGSILITDEAPVYKAVLDYKRRSVEHGKKQFAVGNLHTNTIEGFWSQLKRSINGTYHSVSKKYLQTYVDEFSFYYNARFSLPFEVLMERI